MPGRRDLIGEYLQAISRELRIETHPDERREVDTLYFGGGTPTYLKPTELRQLSQNVRGRHPPAVGYEFTVEANPIDINPEMVAALVDLGATRISLGAQSFSSRKLKLLERDHAPADTGRAVAALRNEGMQVALDLIFATPGETVDDWAADLNTALSLEPNHISTYGLTFEKGASFWSRRQRGDLSEVDEEQQRSMYSLAIDHLTDAGYEQYEVSNFAQPGGRSRHNQVYWSGNGYYAYGPGAARYVNGVRESNHRSTATYLRRVLAGESPIAERECLSPEARARELLVFSLRRMEGVSRQEFQLQTEFTIAELVARPLQKFIELGLLLDDGERIRLSREGLFVSDAIWPELL